MNFTKLFVPVMGALVVLTLSLPVMAQSTSQDNSKATPESSAATKQDSTAPGSMSQDSAASDNKAPAAAKHSSAAPAKATAKQGSNPCDAPTAGEKTKTEMEQ
jgi:cytoskeletal protein RodZ